MPKVKPAEITVVCHACGETNYILVFDGGYFSNDYEDADCAFCGANRILRKKCAMIFSGQSAEDVEGKVRAAFAPRSEG